MKSSTVSSKRILNWVLAVLIVVVSYGFLYKKVWQANLLESLFSLVQSEYVVLWLLLAVLLMPLNWGIEALKWTKLLKPIYAVSFFQALRAVFAGISFSMLTPNRLGEFLGRALTLPSSYTKQGASVTLLGSLCQLTITLVMGVVGGLYLCVVYLSEQVWAWGAWSVLLVVALLAVWILLGTGKWSQRLTVSENWFAKKFRPYISALRGYSVMQIVYVLWLSFVRYIVFAAQFLVLLQLFDFPLGIAESLLALSVYYVVVACIPSFFLSEIGVRGSVVIVAFGWILATITIDPLIHYQALVLTTTLLWCINILLPALIGCLFVFRLRSLNE